MNYIAYLFIVFPWLKTLLVGYFIYHGAGALFIAPGIVVFRGWKFFFLTMPLLFVPGFKSVMKMSFGGESAWDIFMEQVYLFGALMLPFGIAQMMYPNLEALVLIGFFIVGLFMFFAAIIYNLRYNYFVITELWREWRYGEENEGEDEITEEDMELLLLEIKKELTEME